MSFSHSHCSSSYMFTRDLYIYYFFLKQFCLICPFVKQYVQVSFLLGFLTSTTISTSVFISFITISSYKGIRYFLWYFLNRFDFTFVVSSIAVIHRSTVIVYIGTSGLIRFLAVIVLVSHLTMFGKNNKSYVFPDVFLVEHYI